MQDKRACKNTIARDRARDKYVAGRKSKYATARYIAITDLRSWVDRPLTSVPVFDQQGTGTGIRCAKVPAAYRPHVIARDRTYRTKRIGCACIRAGNNCPALTVPMRSQGRFACGGGSFPAHDPCIIRRNRSYSTQDRPGQRKRHIGELLAIEVRND